MDRGISIITRNGATGNEGRDDYVDGFRIISGTKLDIGHF